MFAHLLYSLFRFAGDTVHIYSMHILLTKIRTTKSVSGLSLKTQFLYLLVFITRYLDVFYMRISTLLDVYNTIMKMAYIATQAVIVYMIRYKYFLSYDVSYDTFNVQYITVPSLLLSFLVKPRTATVTSYVVEYLYVFSVLLEAVAILPQLIQLNESGESETLTSRYIFFLGIYRFLYVLNWMVKLFFGYPISHLLLASGIIQTLLYLDFFIIYYQHVFVKKGNVRLPQTSK